MGFFRIGFTLPIILGLIDQTLIAQSPGTFTSTGRMMVPRFLHTATLLLDGRVLIAGGDGSFSAADPAEASAELYDPATGTFQLTGSMTTPRDGHTATLLPNGKVLIAGGGPRINGVYSMASAELYDPASGTFAATGGMNVERWGHTATLLNNGKVLIAGGFRRAVGSSDYSFTVSAELYDPDTGTFARTGDMNGAFCDSATLLADGRVLVTRRNADVDPVTRAEVYDPSTGTFVPTGDATAGHSGPTATLLMNGNVLVAGGDIGDGDGASVIAELYDPVTGTFSRTGELGTGREQNATVLLPDGTVFFAGGHWWVPAANGGFDLTSSAEIYNAVRGTFSTTGSMLTGRDLPGGTLLNDGRVLVTGGNEYYPCCAAGRDSFHPEVPVAELYTPVVLINPPALLSLSGDGRGPGAILHGSTQQVVSPANPATAGEALEIYAAGLADGSAIPPHVTIGGRMAEVLYFGKAPGFTALNQINVRVPNGTVPGSAVPVRLNYLNRPSNEVTMAIQ